MYYLTIQRPNGEAYVSSVLEHQEGKHKLPSEKPIVIIGRENPDPDLESDIKLPANDTLISRQHFCIERRGGWFWVKKMPHSIHSTQIRTLNPASSDEVYSVENTTEGYRLYDKDQILIRSKFPASNNPYWIFTFYDDNQTPFAEMKSSSISYRYNLTYRRLWINKSGSLIEIGLTDQREKLIDYLARKTKESYLAQNQQQNINNFIDVASHEDLIGHLWPKEVSAATKVSLNNVIYQIHEHIREEGKDKQLPRLIESVKRRGYRLVNCEII